MNSYNIPKGLLDASARALELAELRNVKTEEIYNEELAKTGKTIEQLSYDEKNQLLQTVQNRVEEFIVQEKTKALGHTKDMKGGVKKDTDGAHEFNPVDYPKGQEQPEDEDKREKRSVSKSRHPLEDGDSDEEGTVVKSSQATTGTE